MFIFIFILFFLVCGFYLKMVWYLNLRIPEYLGLEGTSGDHLFQPPWSRCRCTGSCPGRFWIFPEKEKNTASMGSLLLLSHTFRVKWFFFTSKWKFLCISFPHFPFVPPLHGDRNVLLTFSMGCKSRLASIFTKEIKTHTNKQLKKKQNQIWITLQQSTRT